MLLYIIIALLSFLAAIFAAGKLRKKYDLYQDSDKPNVIVLLLVLSVLWIVTIPIGLLVLVLYLLLSGSLKLLERFEK